VKGGGTPYNWAWRTLTTARREKATQGSGNAYNLRELAGAFGDLGTLIPFLIGYITISKLDPVGVLVAFGLFKIIAGLYFKTPIPIQPMKAIGTAAISHAGALTAGARRHWVYGRRAAARGHRAPGVGDPVGSAAGGPGQRRLCCLSVAG